jgi:hypothetical protein
LLLRVGHGWNDGSCDGGSDCVLNREYVLQRAIVSLRPDVVTGIRVDELCDDANLGSAATLPSTT